MLTRDDTLELPAGVSLTGGILRDDVREAAVPVNRAAAIVLGTPGASLGAIASEVEAAYALPPERALDDVLRFVWQLNALGLVNVRRRGGVVQSAIAWIVLALWLLPTATVPATLVRRHRLDTTSMRRAVSGVAAGLAPRAVGVGLGAGALVLPPAAFVGNPVGLATAIGLGVAASVVVHEAGHAAALARASPAALIVAWRRVSVVHGPLHPFRAEVVAAAGPLSSAVVGLLAAGLAVVVHLPELAVGALPLAAQALGLTLVTSDGRNACGT